jgi:hypothetical protein
MIRISAYDVQFLADGDIPDGVEPGLKGPGAPRSTRAIQQDLAGLLDRMRQIVAAATASAPAPATVTRDIALLEQLCAEAAAEPVRTRLGD